MPIIISPRLVADGRQAGCYDGYAAIADVWKLPVEDVTEDTVQRVLDDPNATVVYSESLAWEHIERYQAHHSATFTTLARDLIDIREARHG